MTSVNIQTNQINSNEIAEYLNLEELELMHERDMAQAALENFTRYASRMCERGQAGDVDILNHALHKAVAVSVKFFQKNEHLFEMNTGKGRKSAISCLYHGRPFPLRIKENGKVKTVMVQPPNLIDIVRKFGEYALKAEQVFHDVDSSQTHELGLRMLLGLTTEQVLNVLGPHKTDERKTDIQSTRTLGWIGGHVGRALADATAHLEFISGSAERAEYYAKALSPAGKQYDNTARHRNYGTWKAATNLEAHRLAETAIQEDLANGLADAEKRFKDPHIAQLSAQRKAAKDAWGDNTALTGIGIVLAEMVLVANGWGEVYVPHKQAAEIRLSDKFYADFQQIRDIKLEGVRSRWPMLIQPMPWEMTEDGMVGGYLMNCDDELLVRRRNQQAKTILNEAQGSGEPEYISAINNLGATRFELNPLIVGLQKHFAECEIDIGSFVVSTPPDWPKCPEEFEFKNQPNKETDEAGWIAWDKRAQEWKALNQPKMETIRRINGRRMATAAVLRLYDKFEAKGFHHAFSFDSRGRMYPVASILSPQGADFERAALRFATGVPLEGSCELRDGTVYKWTAEDTLEASAIDVANKVGKAGKVTFQERRKWTFDNLSYLKQVAADWEENYREWRNWDEPWAAVAAVDEFLRVFDAVNSGEIEGVTCQVMSEWDATSSGLQHLAAGTRCSELAPLVNICHNTEPGDIYSVVSARAAEIVDDKVANEPGYIDPRLKTERLPYEWKFSRTAAKRGGAMTLPYGARLSSARDKIQAMLNENQTPWIKPYRPVGADGKPIIAEKDADPRFTNYTNAIWTAVLDKVNRPVKAMAVMQKIFWEYAKRMKGQRDLYEARPFLLMLWAVQALNPQLALLLCQCMGEIKEFAPFVDPPLVFKTPSGFPCTFMVPMLKGRKAADEERGEEGVEALRLRIVLPNMSNGATRKVGLNEKDYTRCDWQKVSGKVAPGVIHSLDASLLHRLLGSVWADCSQFPATVIHDALLVPAPLASLMQQAGCDAFADIHDHNGRSFLEDLAEQALGEVPDFLTNEDEDENVISRSPDAWVPDDARNSPHLFS